METVLIEFNRYKKELAKVNKELALLPKGSLIKIGECYYHKIGEKRVGITNNTRLIKQLTRKRHLLDEKRQLEHNLTILSRAVKKLELRKRSELISSLSKTYQNLPITYFYHSYVEPWLAEDYAKNTRSFNGSGYTTKNGVTVRSKSEWIIATALETNQIPYRYEALLKLGSQMISPDFTIMHPFTGEIILWEHFGALHQPNYETSMNKKMDLYYKHDYIEGKTIIYTFEAHIKDPDRLQNLIEKLFS